jgi:3-methylcrotonyl-CoA carboxylase alpha subunit
VRGSPWEETDNWRMSGTGQRHWRIRHADETEDLRLSFRGSVLSVHMRGIEHMVSGEVDGSGAAQVRVDGTDFTVHVFSAKGAVHLFLDGRHHVFEWLDPYLPESTAHDHHGGLVAPMPGRVIAVLVENGARVLAGAPLIVMEAMKMEHTVTAPADGIVADIHCQAGEQVREGDELLKLTPAS